MTTRPRPCEASRKLVLSACICVHRRFLLCGFVRGDLSGDFGLVAYYYDGHLRRNEVGFSHALYVRGLHFHDLLHVGGKVRAVEALRIHTMQLSDDGVRADGVAQNEDPGQVVLDSLQLLPGWRILAQPVDLVED